MAEKEQIDVLLPNVPRPPEDLPVPLPSIKNASSVAKIPNQENFVKSPKDLVLDFNLSINKIENLIKQNKTQEAIKEYAQLKKVYEALMNSQINEQGKTILSAKINDVYARLSSLVKK